jgi:hypothetical protein
MPDPFWAAKSLQDGTVSPGSVKVLHSSLADKAFDTLEKLIGLSEEAESHSPLEMAWGCARAFAFTNISASSRVS